MKAPVVLVTATLAVAILLVASLLIATGTRGKDATGLPGETPTARSLPVTAKPHHLSQTRAKPC